MDMYKFWSYLTFVLLISTIILALKSILFTKTPEKKYLWTWNGLISATCCMVVLLFMQNTFEVIGILIAKGWILALCKYLPYILWILSIYYLRKTALAMNESNFRKTHFSSVYVFDCILLALLLPLANIFISFMIFIKSSSGNSPMFF